MYACSVTYCKIGLKAYLKKRASLEAQCILVLGLALFMVTKSNEFV